MTVPTAYDRAKVDQEQIVTAAETPWSIVRATRFRALPDRIFSLTARAGVLPARAFSLQPIAARTVARALADAVESGPSHARVEIAGPGVLLVSGLARHWRPSTGRWVVLVPVATLGAVGRGLRSGALTSSDAATHGSPTFEQWLRARDSGRAARSACARPGARPVPGRRLPAGKVSGRLSVGLQQTLTRLAASPRRPAALGLSPYTLLTTFRRDGSAVAVPVWASDASHATDVPRSPPATWSAACSLPAPRPAAASSLPMRNRSPSKPSRVATAPSERSSSAPST